MKPHEGPDSEARRRDPGGGPSGACGGDGIGASGSSSDDLERFARTLLFRLVPPLVHRLNNSLAVLQSAWDLGPADPTGTVERRELSHLGAALGRLSGFAREHVPERRLFDPALVMRGHDLLLRPLAEACGVELGLEVLSEGGTVHADPLVLERLLVLLAGHEILAIAGPGGAGRASGGRLRVRLGLQGERAVWTITSSRSPSASPGSSPEESDRDARRSELLRQADRALATAADDVTVTVRTMRFGGEPGREVAPGGGEARIVTGTRLGLPLVAVPRDEFPPEPLGRGARLLLVEDDEAEGELVSEVLREAGFHVRGLGADEPSPDRIARSSADLILLGSGVDEARPGFFAELARVPAAVDRLVLLGQPPADLAPYDVAYASRPLRPRELLAAVYGRMGGAPTRQPER